MTMFGLFCNRNILSYLFGLITNSENESNNWPTPFLSYCPPELRSPSFFLCTFILQSLLMLTSISEAFVTINLVCLSSERVLADFQTLFILLDDFADVYPDLDVYNVHSDNMSQVNQCKNIDYNHKTETTNLRRDMALIVRCHQTLCRNFRVTFKASEGMISMLNMVSMLFSCSAAYLLLTVDDFNKRVNFTVSFIVVGLATFFSYHNGQRVFNQDTYQKFIKLLL
ncbi:uncharacterized protein LOC120352898 [Nilaparvata lugens]|uniref:uncharacterized protein LOC120352898 n=1 Tax=Nilaparvata lugens TaxID=108931 RepID=UPI00193D4182|nr:uncharacterized protein LOC120352898 [Nilaparvata lugens]